MRHKLICYGCGKATNEGYHVLCDGTIYHYCPECVDDVKAVQKNEQIQAIERF